MRRFSIVFTLMLAVVMMAATGLRAQDEAAPPEPAPAQQEAQAQGAEDEGQITLMRVIGWGGAIGYFIIFLSFVTVVLIIAHAGTMRRSRLMPAKAMETLGEFLSNEKVDEAYEYAENEGSLLSRVIAGGLSRLDRSYEEMEQVMSDVAEDEAMRMEQGVGYFSLLAAVSPLCGLLGTVIGMILAFNQIAVRGVTTPGDLAAPIQQALVTTCFGLVVAIPNVVAFTFFRNKMRRYMADLSVLVDEFMLPYRDKPVAAAAALAPSGATAAVPVEENVPMLKVKGEADPFEEQPQEPTPFDEPEENPSSGSEAIEESSPVDESGAEQEAAESPKAEKAEADPPGEAVQEESGDEKSEEKEG